MSLLHTELFPILADDVLFVEEDGIFFCSRPGHKVRQLNRTDNHIFKLCTGSFSLEELIRSISTNHDLSLERAFSEVIAFIDVMGNDGFVLAAQKRSPRALSFWSMNGKSFSELMAEVTGDAED